MLDFIVGDDEFSRLKLFVSRMGSIFGTTYVCEQTFKKLSVKLVYQTRLTDEHLKTNLLTGCSNSKAKIYGSVKAKSPFRICALKVSYNYFFNKYICLSGPSFSLFSVWLWKKSSESRINSSKAKLLRDWLIESRWL